MERRYALDDFARFFAGWELRITGTIAGVDRYPPAAHAQPAATEAGVIEARLPPTTDPAPASADAGTSRVAGACDVRYAHYQGPARLAPGAASTVTVDVVNAGWDVWRSDGPNPVHVSYHWLTSARAMVDFDGLRSDLPHPLAPGQTCRATLAIRAPDTPGAYLLAIDLVREGVTWFSEAGGPCHTAPLDVP